MPSEKNMKRTGAAVILSTSVVAIMNDPSFAGFIPGPIYDVIVSGLAWESGKYLVMDLWDAYRRYLSGDRSFAKRLDEIEKKYAGSSVSLSSNVSRRFEKDKGLYKPQKPVVLRSANDVDKHLSALYRDKDGNYVPAIRFEKDRIIAGVTPKKRVEKKMGSESKKLAA